MSENVVHMKLEGSSKSHSRADIIARDVESVIDEPVARGGTNLGCRLRKHSCPHLLAALT